MGEGLGVKLGGSGKDVFGTVLIPATPGCRDDGSGGAANGPLDEADGEGCLDQAQTADPVTGLCPVTGTTNFLVYCGEAHPAIPLATATRAVHQIGNSEWTKKCAVIVPDDPATSLASLAAGGQPCATQNNKTVWEFDTLAPDCLGQAEANPLGDLRDLNATYKYATPNITLQGNGLQVAKLEYEFKLPTLNTNTLVELNFTYQVENAILAVVVQAGPDAVGGGTGLYIVGDPKLTVDPLLETAGGRGSLHRAFALQSSNATKGKITFLLTPTTWIASPASPANLARVQLCNTAIKVSTFAKQGWHYDGKDSAPGGTGYPIGALEINDQGASGQIDPASSRMRVRYDASTNQFVDLGPEREDFLAAIEIPNRAARTNAVPNRHRVRNPDPTPTTPATPPPDRDLGAYLKDVLDPAGQDLTAPGKALAGFWAYDPLLDVQDLACDPHHGVTGQLCLTWNQAKNNDQIALLLRDPYVNVVDPYINGRFYGSMPVLRQAFVDAGGTLRWRIAEGVDPFAGDAINGFERRWKRTVAGDYVQAFEVADFYGNKPQDGLDASALPLAIEGWIQVRTQNGSAILSLKVTIPAAVGTHEVSTDLNCVTVDQVPTCL